MQTIESVIAKKSCFEDQLINSLHPIRYYALAVTIYHLFQSKIYHDIAEGDVEIEHLAKHHGCDLNKLIGMLLYLQNEGIVLISENSVALTPQGQLLKDAEPWYTMLIGGYAETFHSIGEGLLKDAPHCSRNSAAVGIGSCGISYYDAIPLTKNLISYMEVPPKFLLDLGCGNAMYLTEFCKQYPTMYACGVEPSKKGYEEALIHVAHHNMDDRIRLINMAAQEFINKNQDFAPDLLVIGFVLHEILGQDGEKGVIDFLTNIINKYPDLYLIVI